MATDLALQQFYDRVSTTPPSSFEAVVDATCAFISSTIYRDPKTLEHRGQPPVSDTFEDVFRLANTRAHEALRRSDEDTARIKLFVDVMMKLHSLSSTDSKRKFASYQGEWKPHPLGIAWARSLDLNVADASGEARLERCGRGILLYLSTLRTSLTAFIMLDLPDEVGVLRPLGISNPLTRLAARGNCLGQIKFIVGVTGVLPRITDLAAFIRRIGVNEWADLLRGLDPDNTVVVPVCKSPNLSAQQKIAVASEVLRITGTEKGDFRIIPRYVFSALKYTERDFKQAATLVELQPKHGGNPWEDQPPLSSMWMPSDRKQLVFVCKVRDLLCVTTTPPKGRRRNAKRALPRSSEPHPRCLPESDRICHPVEILMAEDEPLRWIFTERLDSLMTKDELKLWNDLSAPQTKRPRH